MDGQPNQIFTEYLAEREARRMKMERGWLLAKQTTWFALLTGGYLALYLLDILNESLKLLGISF